LGIGRVKHWHRTWYKYGFWKRVYPKIDQKVSIKIRGSVCAEKKIVNSAEVEAKVCSEIEENFSSENKSNVSTELEVLRCIFFYYCNVWYIYTKVESLLKTTCNLNSDNSFRYLIIMFTSYVSLISPPSPPPQYQQCWLNYGMSIDEMPFWIKDNFLKSRSKNNHKST